MAKKKVSKKKPATGKTRKTSAAKGKAKPAVPAKKKAVKKTSGKKAPPKKSSAKKTPAKKTRVSNSSLQAEYRKLQSDLVTRWTFADPAPDLVAKMARLRPKLDPAWLADVRTCTTPPSPVDVAKVLPQIGALAKTTVRLNPRRGTAAPDASKIGGLFLWPQADEWPHCDEHDSAYVTALQIAKADFPEVEFPKGMDLMQVLWCPNDHEPHYCPHVRVFWQKAGDIRDPVSAHPKPNVEESLFESYVPRPCRLYPERIVEYPDPFEQLPCELTPLESSAEVAAALAANEVLAAGNWSTHRNADRLYQCALSTSEGTKLGGYPDWVQDPWYPKCQCGQTMEPLVDFNSWEFDGETWFRWLPIEERDVLETDYEIRNQVQNPPMWMFGDAGNMYVFVCRKCPDWPVVAGMQCS